MSDALTVSLTPVPGEGRPTRIMWLLNHTTAREFEIPMMQSLGFNEFFLPKMIPQTPGFRSGSIDYSEDANLTIPREDLDILNRADWYGEPDDEAWAVANRHFDVMFFILQSSETLRLIAKNFQGAVIWRAYGLQREMNYTKLLAAMTKGRGGQYANALGERFWLGAAYEKVIEVEPSFLARRAVYLPLGMQDQTLRTGWTGETASIFFVCPDISTSDYYQAIYRTFKTDFEGFPYAIGGTQPAQVTDPAVLGYLPLDEHLENMRRYRVMFYHSTEPSHVHYHPFEAVRAGMPLIFMAGSLFDTLGGHDLPGRCTTIAEARKKIRRILDGDWAFIETIRKSQIQLLDSMNPENCVAAWQIGMPRILASLKRVRATKRPPVRTRKRIAIILPIVYQGGTFESAKQLARALYGGSRQAGEAADIVFGHPADPAVYPHTQFNDLPQEIKRRPFNWRRLNPDEATIAADYAAPGLTLPGALPFLLPDDGINHFLDCDLWIIISDRVSVPILPVRPYIMVVHDYLQRYEPVVGSDSTIGFLHAAHGAERVLVTSQFTFADASQYAGLPEAKLRHLPLMLPKPIDKSATPARTARAPYFVWPTNLAIHKNHANAAEALREYYEELDGQFECRVTGAGTQNLLGPGLAHLTAFQEHRAAGPLLKRKLRLMGYLRNAAYGALLTDAAFVWHPAKIDNGAFAVIEAAMRGVPALSSDYPAMREIDGDFQLSLTWMDSNNPTDMARQLKFMEENAASLRGALPTAEILARHSVEQLAPTYWKAVRECL